MARFNPAMLVPAHQVEGLAKGSAARTTTQVALDNINRMKAEFQAPEQAEGRKSWKVVGDRVVFSIRVSNTALVLERAKVQDSEVEVEVREMTAPKANFLEALDYYADRIKAGEYEAQLTAMAGKKDERSATRRANKVARDAKPAEEKKAS